MVVSPLDAEDVSKVVKFCLKHNLSPSVKAGGYGIAGWSVAGDVIIDMSLIRHVDIEPPIPEEEGGCRWTPLKDMPPPGSKGKGKASEVKRKPEVTAIADPPQAEATSMKRRRDDRGDSPTPVEKPSAYGPTDDESRSRVYDAASYAVGAFFRGPPLPLVPGETPREPPRNKRRIDSPVPENSTDVVHHLPLLESKQVSSESSAGGGSTSGSAFGLSTERTLSTETAVTAPTDIPLDSADNAPASVAESNITPTAATEPFGYMSSGPPASRPPMYTGSEPFAYMSSASTVLTPSNILSSWRPPAAVSWAGPSINPSTQGSSSAMLSFMPSLPSMPGTFALPQSHVGNVAPARPVYDHAYVTFGAGMRQKEVDTFTAENPLEGISGASGLREEGLVPYHIPTSAHPVGSSVMILSGFGFLSRLHGLSIDNVVEIEMVLADGRIVIANKDDDPDLWWAVRGAGPAFGIATRYKAKAFPVPVCFAGNLIYRFHRATAPSLIKHFRDCIKGAPRELYANVLLTAGPADKDSLVVIQMCYLGPKEEGLEYLQAISSWDGERCLLNEVNEKSFLYQQDSVAQVLRGKRAYPTCSLLDRSI
ncbi:hypothetical protein EW026_g3081 [Hermanssonia centrifuga]|uniref:FAD-binding PCMH-type domain-containing protein n=1 Tax=Hermanssonia centrifuga TaxID=98765 RepID=A0A4S4KLW2_9APHY|nr:hypothetical protein EW026_g3081 [Hermanssonia centrifuga]